MEENLKHKTKKGIYWTFINQFFTNGLSFVVGIIMARLLSPSDYGITALPAVFICIANVFIESGFTSAMVRKPELSESDLSTAFFYSASVGVACYLALFFGAPFIAEFYNVPVLTPLIRVTALTFLWTPLITPQTIILKRKLDFKTPARITITNKLLGAAVGICLAYMGYGVWSLVAMNVVSSFFNLIQTWIAVRWYPNAKWSKESFQYLWGFGNKLVASALLDTVYSNITPIIIGKYYSTKDLGEYDRAGGFASVPATQGTAVIQAVTFPVLSKMQDNTEILANGYRRMLKMSAFVIFPVMTIIAALSKPIIILLLTDKWIGAVILLQILCFSKMWYPIHAINLNLLQVKGRSDLFLKLEIWKKALGLTVMACSLPFGLIYFVSALIVSSFISLFINTYYTGKLIGVGYVKQMHDLLPTYGLSILIFIVIMCMNYFISNMWIQLVLGLCVGVVLYVLIAYLFHFSELVDVKYMLNPKK